MTHDQCLVSEMCIIKSENRKVLIYKFPANFLLLKVKLNARYYPLLYVIDLKVKELALRGLLHK